MALGKDQPKVRPMGGVIIGLRFILSIPITIIVLVDQKIAGLDNELRKYKEQLKKATGPTAANIKKRAMDVLKRKVHNLCRRCCTLAYIYRSMIFLDIAENV